MPATLANREKIIPEQSFASQMRRGKNATEKLLPASTSRHAETEIVKCLCLTAEYAEKSNYFIPVDLTVLAVAVQLYSIDETFP